jgi:UbiD family decarboxylase
VPVVKCVTSDIYVPADAEYVIEGFLDPAGHVEPEGPFGEYVGYYGVVKRNPVLHVTAITHREDALFQSLTIGGRALARTDTAQLSTMKTESAAWAALMASVREPLAVYATPSSGGMYNVRVSLRQRVPGDARNAIAAIFGSHAEAKHVFAFDPDIDVYSNEETDWALATRFQADRDLIVGSGFRVVPLDPSLGGARTGAKLGFDCTIPFGKANALEFSVPLPPKAKAGARHNTAADALAAGPASFLELMAALGSTDGREIVRELDTLYAAQRLGRHDDGRYVLKGNGK